MKRLLILFLLLISTGLFAQNAPFIYRFQPEDKNTGLTASQIDSTISILKKRLSSAGYSSSTVVYSHHDRQFMVERERELDDEFVRKWLIKPCELFFYETYSPAEMMDILFTGENAESAKNDKERLLELLSFPREFQTTRMPANIGTLKGSDLAAFNEVRKKLDPYLPADCRFLYSVKMTPSAHDPSLVSAEVYAIRDNKWKMPLNDIVLSAKGVTSGKYPAVSVELNEIGKRMFSQLTEKNVGKPIAIVIDGRVFSAPFVNAPIDGGKLEIAGIFSKEEATQFSNMLTAGLLRLKLVQVR